VLKLGQVLLAFSARRMPLLQGKPFVFCCCRIVFPMCVPPELATVSISLMQLGQMLCVTSLHGIDRESGRTKHTSRFMAFVLGIAKISAKFMPKRKLRSKTWTPVNVPRTATGLPSAGGSFLFWLFTSRRTSFWRMSSIRCWFTPRSERPASAGSRFFPSLLAATSRSFRQWLQRYVSHRLPPKAIRRLT
jgi:hypothetical protein